MEKKLESDIKTGLYGCLQALGLSQKRRAILGTSILGSVLHWGTTLNPKP